MKPEETIGLLKGMQSPLEDYAELVGAPAFTYGHKYVYPYPEDYAIEEAIEALKEIQQYREIGTVEECKELASIVNMAERNELAKAIDEWLKYNKIGTVEECREAVEKQKPKKPDYEGDGYDDKGELVYDTQICPNCDKKYEVDYDDYKHCPNCGQAIDENLEGMEDECRNYWRK